MAEKRTGYWPLESYTFKLSWATRWAIFRRGGLSISLYVKAYDYPNNPRADPEMNGFIRDLQVSVTPADAPY